MPNVKEQQSFLLKAGMGLVWRLDKAESRGRLLLALEVREEPFQRSLGGEDPNYNIGYMVWVAWASRRYWLGPQWKQIS